MRIVGGVIGMAIMSAVIEFRLRLIGNSIDITEGSTSTVIPTRWVPCKLFKRPCHSIVASRRSIHYWRYSLRGLCNWITAQQNDKRLTSIKRAGPGRACAR